MGPDLVLVRDGKDDYGVLAFTNLLLFDFWGQWDICTVYVLDLNGLRQHDQDAVPPVGLIA